jgi:riboflavin kinase/FMN adenylyltransferase
VSEPIHLPGAALPRDSAAVTVGTFDGVHRGHQAVLKQLGSIARARGLRSVVVTFEPHPLKIIRPDAAPRLLCTAVEKEELLRASQVDHVAVVPFTRALADLEPRTFVERVLIAHFGLSHLVIGYDHGFGKDRSGDAATLQELGLELGYGVTVVSHTDLDARPISSTRIRLLLTEGDVIDAARALGRPYSLQGLVVPGDGLGRELGFPTANLQVAEADKLLPAEGIYAVQVHLAGQQPLRGLLHMGPRPTFGGARPTVEVHLLDFQGNLYGQWLRVALCARIRGVERFADAAELITAMRRDVAAALTLFQAQQSACS